MNFITRAVYTHLIYPFQASTAPISHLARAGVVGTFIGLTPTVGVQMYAAALVWILARYLFRFHFNLPVAVALVWITNPVTVLPIYYLFMITGDWLLVLLGHAKLSMDYATFVSLMNGLEGADPVRLRERLVNALLLLFWTFGWPMVVGSLVYAVPLGLLSYPVTVVSLHRYRRRLAARQGLSYQEWQQRKIVPD